MSRKAVILFVLCLAFIVAICVMVNVTYGSKIEDNNKQIASYEKKIDSNQSKIASYENYIKNFSDESQSEENSYEVMVSNGRNLAKAEKAYIDAIVKFEKKNPDATTSYIPDNDKVMQNIHAYVDDETYDEIRNIRWGGKNCQISFDSDFEVDGDKFNVVWTVWEKNKLATVITGVYDSESKKFTNIDVHFLN